jgi:hypothetical protein
MFIAGRYTATYGGLALGQTADGIRLSFQRFVQQVRGDAFAQTVQDQVLQGGEMDLAARLIEYDAAAVQSAMWPLSTTIFAMGQVGRLDVQSNLIKQIVLTAVAGTPAAATPATITLPRCILKENFPVELLFAPALREVPLRWRVYLDSQGLFASQT